MVSLFLQEFGLHCFFSLDTSVEKCDNSVHKLPNHLDLSLLSGDILRSGEEDLRGYFEALDGVRLFRGLCANGEELGRD